MEKKTIKVLSAFAVGTAFGGFIQKKLDIYAVRKVIKEIVKEASKLDKHPGHQGTIYKNYREAK